MKPQNTTSPGPAEGPQKPAMPATGREKPPKGDAGDTEGIKRNPKEPTESPAGTPKDQERSPETARRAPNRPQQGAQRTLKHRSRNR